ncbi:hypothetical protein F0261_08010 [Alteromonas sp. 07-89-2]|uniref:hypothetical protein n=1 Tax=Alteromonas sp. 07-89-2 TaxID=2607609 RepID=UPI00148B5639|nr:hypothetical protein [Alteromonas sp. 07-89-2]NOH57979.1 hypothetical protein [Alteromonas sp. 07-89-2]
MENFIDFITNPDQVCNVNMVLAAIIGVLGLLYVHKRNRDVALQAIKVDLLDIIDGLAKDKAWLFPTRHFSIARAFSLYYGKAIPFSVIRILCQSEDADAAFTSYCKVSGLVNVKKDSGDIETLSAPGMAWRISALIIITFWMFSLTGLLFTL